MKKKMITVIIIVVALVAAFLISTGFRKRTDVFVAVNLIKESEKILTVEEGVTIADILEKEEWMEGAPACDNDYKIVINKEIYYYHSSLVKLIW